MLTGTASLESWLRGYEVDSVLGRVSGSGRGARDYADVPLHRYDSRVPKTQESDKQPTHTTHVTTGTASIGNMLVRNTITGELRTLSQVWAEAKDAHYATDAKGNVSVVAEVVDDVATVQVATAQDESVLATIVPFPQANPAQATA